MALFDLSVNKTLKTEGGFVFIPATGECSNFGISLWLLRDLGQFPAIEGPPTPSEMTWMHAMTRDFAVQTYRSYFWDFIKGDSLKVQSIADKVFDLAVNMGRVTAVQLMQKTLGIHQDGLVGSQTITAINAADAVTLLQRYRVTASGRYAEIAAKNHKLAGDLPGWLTRLAS